MGLIYGSRFEDIEPLAPLIGLLELPLFVTEKEIADRINRSHPNVNCHLVTPNDLGKNLFKTGNTLISCLPISKIRQIFYLEEMMQKRRFHTVFLPHGPTEVLPPDEKHILVYGPEMIDLFLENHPHLPFKSLVSIAPNNGLPQIRERVLLLLQEIEADDNTFY